MPAPDDRRRGKRLGDHAARVSMFFTLARPLRRSKLASICFFRIFQFVHDSCLFPYRPSETLPATNWGDKSMRTERRFRSIFAAVFALLVCLAPCTSAAAEIRFDFTGSVTDDAINGCGVVVACGTLSGSYVFESGAPDGNPAADTGLYVATQISLSIDGNPFFSAANGLINVANFASVDQYGLLALAGLAGNGSTADLSMLLEDLAHTAFASDALPLTAVQLAALLPGTFQLNANDDSFQLLGSITAVTCSRGCDDARGIPEPSTIPLLGAGLALLALARLRRLRPSRLSSAA